MNVNATICGVKLFGLKVMNSKFAGYDLHTGKRFKAGEQIAYLHGSKLTPKESKALFPNGKISAISVRWPLGDGRDIPMQQKELPFVASFTPSEYQVQILSTLLDGEDHILIKAFAGTGKTSTLVWLVQELSKRGLTNDKKIIYLAFNKSIQEELSEKLAGTGVPALTTHAFGFQAIKKVFGGDIKPTSGKCASDTFLKLVCDENGLPNTAVGFRSARHTEEYSLRSAVLELVGYIKSWAICPLWSSSFSQPPWQFSDEQKEAILELVEMYEIELPNTTFSPEDLMKYACDVVTTNLPIEHNSLVQIDYDDMLYFPLVFNMKLPKYDLVLTDESQDFNRCQIILLEKLIEE
jgi:superfamily I DNA/RNA helicase